jgi:hypothetical protein
LPENISEIPTPKFFSLAFHLRFFPQLLITNIKNHPDSRKGHIFFEVPIALAVCGFFLATGLPSAVERHSIGGGS